MILILNQTFFSSQSHYCLKGVIQFNRDGRKANLILFTFSSFSDLIQFFNLAYAFFLFKNQIWRIVAIKEWGFRDDIKTIITVFIFCLCFLLNICWLFFQIINRGAIGELEMVNPNRLSSRIGGNREMDQLNMTSQVSNLTRNTKFSPNSWHVFQN